MWLPRPLSWSCLLTPRHGACASHAHGYDEICLVVGDRTTILHAGVEHHAAPGTAFLFRHGEAHGYRNRPDQEPHLWLVHYQPDPDLSRDCPQLDHPDPLRRIWRLDADRIAAYQAIFMRMMAESVRADGPGQAAASSAWLRLLLIGAARWDADEAPPPAEVAADPGTARLWELLHEHVESPDADLAAAIARRVPDYDSLRHRFKRRYGLPPREMRQRMRIERAKYLLLDSNLGIGAIAERLGYARAAEFARAFARSVGCSPGAFRRRPASTSASSGPAPANDDR